MRRVDISGLWIHDKPFSTGAGNNKYLAFRRKTGRLYRVSDIFAPNYGTTHGVPELKSSIVAERQKLRLGGMNAQARWFLRMTNH